MNEKQMQFLAQSFNLMTFKKMCNYKDCHKYPSKEIILYETDIITKEEKIVASLYFCSEHYNKVARQITTKLNEIANKRWVIDKRVRETGFITH